MVGVHSSSRTKIQRGARKSRQVENAWENGKMEIAKDCLCTPHSQETRAGSESRQAS